MKKIRVHQLAKELNQTNAQLIDVAKLLKIEISSHLSSLNDKDVVAIKNYLQNKVNQNDTIDLEEENNNDYAPELNGLIRQKFQKLRTVDDFVSLVNLVNTKIYKQPHLLAKKHLTYYAFINKKKYTKFEIAKKSGGTREIYAPSKGLKYILQTLNVIFQALYKPQVSTHGFLQKRSVVTNAALHVNKNYVYNIDLENFFPSIHQARIWKRLQYPPFNLSGNKTEIANLIANLACYQFDRSLGQKNFLPQGAPTSPILSNIICYRLDKKIIELAKNYNVKYTRYADDMTFSSDHNVYQENSEFIQALEKIIKNENFCINSKKTRLQKRGYKQEVTGLIVNDKINVTRSYVKNLRALLHLVEKYGEKRAQKIFEKNNPEKNLFLVIQGKLQYLKMVKGFEDSTYKKLCERFEKIFQPALSANESKCFHNPKALVGILKLFSKEGSPFKVTSHSENYKEYEDYKTFMRALSNEWKDVKDDLKKYSKRLHGKIASYFFEDKFGEKDEEGYLKAWGEHKIQIGWSSPELKEWCESEWKPFEYRLPEYKTSIINNESIEKFLDVTTKIFKHEIEIREEGDRLYNIFIDIADEEKMSELCVEYDESLFGKDFYTDVHLLKEAIRLMFLGILAKISEGRVILVRAIPSENYDFIDIEIVHKGSKSKRESKDLLKKVERGEFIRIKKHLCSLCDWSVITSCADGNYRINYLKQEGVEDIEKIDFTPEGFTHILRFYK